MHNKPSPLFVKGGLGSVDFVYKMPEEFTLTEQMVEALGVTPIETYVGRDLMFVLESEKAVQTATQDLWNHRWYTVHYLFGSRCHLSSPIILSTI